MLCACACRSCHGGDGEERKGEEKFGLGKERKKRTGLEEAGEWKRRRLQGAQAKKEGERRMAHGSRLGI